MIVTLLNRTGAQVTGNTCRDLTQQDKGASYIQVAQCGSHDRDLTQEDRGARYMQHTIVTSLNRTGAHVTGNTRSCPYSTGQGSTSQATHDRDLTQQDRGARYRQHTIVTSLNRNRGARYRQQVRRVPNGNQLRFRSAEPPPRGTVRINTPCAWLRLVFVVN